MCALTEEIVVHTSFPETYGTPLINLITFDDNVDNIRLISENYYDTRRLM